MVLPLALTAGCAASGSLGSPPRGWASYVPDRVPSDSAFAALHHAADLGALTDHERRWLRQQRRWRAERRAEQRPGRSISAPTGHLHHALRSDSLYAALASRSPATLSEDEFRWLMDDDQRRRSLDVKTGVAALLVFGLFVLVGMGAAAASSLGGW